jgi:predicted nucleic acid-binding protein
LIVDLRTLLRRRKPEKRLTQLALRPREQLFEWTALAGGPPTVLVLDTTVYVHRAAGKLPQALQDVVNGALLFHCSVALSELAIGVASADPTLPSWPALRDHYADLFDAIPASRLLTPDAQVLADAGLIAGTLARAQGFQPHQRKELFNDALIFLTAAKAGLPVLTANRDEFDLIQQLAPEGQFIHY